MIDSARTDSSPQVQSDWPTQNPPFSSSRQSWIGTMATSVFNLYLELFREFEERMQPVLRLPDLMVVVEDCICQETETLARMAIKIYSEMLLSLSAEEAAAKKAGFADLVCTRLTKCLCQSFCIDFGEAGVLDLVEDTPSDIAEALSDCPVSMRTRSDESHYSVKSLEETCSTSYGTGQFVKVCSFGILFVISHALLY